MSSLSTRLLLALVLLVGLAVGVKTWRDLDRVRIPAASAQGQRIQVVLLEAAPLLERAYAAEGLSGVKKVLAQVTLAGGGGRSLANRSASDAPQPFVAAIADPVGRVVSAGTDGLEGRWALETALAPAARLARASTGRHVRIAAEGNVIYAALPLSLEPPPPPPGLIGPPREPIGAAHALLRHDLSAAFAAARGAALRDNALLAGALLFALILLGLGLHLGLGLPARRVLATLERLDRGELEARTGLRGGTELTRIGSALDAMAERFQAREAELVELNARLDTVLESLPLGVMVIRREDGRPLYVNTRWMELYGIPMDDSRDILSLLSGVRCERPDGSSIPVEQLPIPIVLRTGVPAEPQEVRVRRDDAVIHLVASAVPIKLWSAEVFDAVVGTVQVPRRAFIAQEGRAGFGAGLGEPSLPGYESETSSEEAPSGETFLQSLPAWASKGSSETVGQGMQPSLPSRRTVLVVEGEAALRELAEQVLADAGYRVIVTGSGEEALSLFSVESRTVGAVVLDLWVAAPSGRMLAEELLELDAGARLIGASGYRNDLPEMAARGLMAAFLPKPYGGERLLKTVRDVLARGLAAAAAGPV